MKTKLIKERFDFYGLKVDDKIIATNNVEINKIYNYPFIISIKNCQAIERGYDLDELANELECYTAPHCYDFKTKEKIGFKLGFQKALEIIGDKKFNIEQVVELAKILISNPISTSGKHPQELVDAYVKSLQKTEWEVELVMEDCFLENNEVYIDETNTKGNYSTHYKKPKLDSNGCLILKLVK